MHVVKQIFLEQFRLQQHSQAQVESFVLKVCSVLVAEGLSTTFYEVMSMIMVGDDGTMTDDESLIVRSLYAGFITLYAPVVAWLMAKRNWIMTGKSFLAISMNLKMKVCPVLLAWGWKDWAAELDAWAGQELWDESVVAVCITAIVFLLQATPAYRSAKKGVVAGGSEDTLLRRFLIIPSGMMLTLGYVWDTVATWFVDKLQQLGEDDFDDDDSGFNFDFCVQAIYTIVVGIIVTLLSVRLIKARVVDRAAEDVVSKRVKIRPTYVSYDHIWEADLDTAWHNVVLSIMSFVYAWAVLDTCDDLGFGVMFRCTSPTECSYENNFAYCVCLTVFFAALAVMLGRWQQLEEGEEGDILRTLIGLQTNAMVLTVGWAWMNFYTVYLEHVTSEAAALAKVSTYAMALVAFSVVSSMAMYVFTRMRRGLEARIKEHIDALEAIEDAKMRENMETMPSTRNGERLPPPAHTLRRPPRPHSAAEWLDTPRMGDM